MSTFAVISTSGLSFDKRALKLSATAKLVVRTNSSGAAKCLTSRSNTEAKRASWKSPQEIKTAYPTAIIAFFGTTASYSTSKETLIG